VTKKHDKMMLNPEKNRPCAGVKFDPISTRLCRSYFL